MNRRLFVSGVSLLAAPPLWAHHGWSSFDQDRPIWLKGRAAKVQWRNPHVEFDLELKPGLTLPTDLATRRLPSQSAKVDGVKLMGAAQLPKRRDHVWHIELAPLTRLEAWKVAEIRPGDDVAVLGFTFAEEKGDPVLRAEYLFVGDKVYGLRSSPA